MSDSDCLDLFQRWGAGSSSAGTTLYRRYTPRLTRYFASKVLPHEIDELVQLVWLAVMQASKRMNASTTVDEQGGVEPSVVIRTSVRAYVIGIARNVLFHYYRQLRAHAEFDPEVDCVEALMPSLSRALSVRRRVKLIEMALAKLPLEVQLLAEARYVDGLSGPELAEVFGIPEGTVRSRLARVRSLLGDLVPMV